MKLSFINKFEKLWVGLEESDLAGSFWKWSSIIIGYHIIEIIELRSQDLLLIFMGKLFEK